MMAIACACLVSGLFFVDITKIFFVIGAGTWRGKRNGPLKSSIDPRI